MKNDEIRVLSKLVTASNNDLTGLPELHESRDDIGERTADLHEDVIYIADVSKLIEHRAQMKMCDLAAIAAEAAKQQAESETHDKYRGGEFADVEIKITISEGDETIHFKDGKFTIGVPLTIEVDATAPDESHEPEFCGVLRKWI